MFEKQQFKVYYTKVEELTFKDKQSGQPTLFKKLTFLTPDLKSMEFYVSPVDFAAKYGSLVPVNPVKDKTAKTVLITLEWKLKQGNNYKLTLTGIEA